MIPFTLAHAAIGIEMVFSEPSSSLGSIVSLSNACDNNIHGLDLGVLVRAPANRRLPTRDAARHGIAP
jgi:hypothetical protein